MIQVCDCGMEFNDETTDECPICQQANRQKENNNLERFPLPRGNAKMLAEIADPQNYERHFKNVCFGCQVKIPARWYHYRVFGNFCNRCCTEADKRAKRSVTARIKTARKEIWGGQRVLITNN